jgi:hypothetical protein
LKAGDGANVSDLSVVRAEELYQLPLRAIVALAVRCARRVEPLTARLGEQSKEIFDSAIATAQTFAAGVSLEMNTVDEAARAAARAADVVLHRSDLESIVRAGAANAARAAWAAAETARAASAYTRARGDGAGTEADFEAKVASQTAEAADDAATAAGGVDAARAARADLSRLLGLNLGGPGELGRPIDASENGPLGALWPDGAPDWYLHPAS